MNTCDFIIDTLYKNGIDTFFVLTGGAIVPLIDAISKNEKVRYYCFQHEQSAAMAAEGYYRSSGKIAAVCVTSGPGVQNILNGVCGCWYDSVPAFFISGQVNTSENLSHFHNSKPRQSGFQETPVVKFFEDVTKKTIHVDSVHNIPEYLHELIGKLKTPRYGPVLLDLPVNIQMSKMEVTEPIFIDVSNKNEKCSYDISDFITQSARPLLVLGHGIKLSNATQKAIELVESTGIPFVVSYGGFDICKTEHPLRFGTIGVYGDRYANYAIQNADLVISIGTRLDSRQIGGNTKYFSRSSKKIMVDIDENEINKMQEKGVIIDYGIVSDAYDFIDNVIVGKKNDFSDWVHKLKSWKDTYAVEKARDDDSSVYDYLQDFFDTLPNDCIVIPDTGGNLVWTMQSAKLNDTQKLFTNFGNSSMGFSLPASIGAAIGSGKKVYSINGDGGIQLNIQELLTVKKYNLPIDIIILNNSGYGIIKQFQDSYFNSDYTATSKTDVFGDTVDFVKIAEAYGVKTLKDVQIPGNQKIYPKLEFGNSLENMTPYIDFEKDMIVEVPPKKKQGWN